MRGGLDRGLHLCSGMHPICKCSHWFAHHLSGDGRNHYAMCRVGNCSCDSLKSMDNLEYLEFIDRKRGN